MKELKRGFTLFEILLVVFLLGSIALMMVSNFDSLFEKDPLYECEDAFQEAMGMGRMLAFENKKPLVFTWDKDGGRFVLIDEVVVQSFVVEEVKGSKLTAVFFVREALQKGSSFNEARWVEVESISIFEDATVTPFRLEISVGTRKRIFEVEPFSGQVLISG